MKIDKIFQLKIVIFTPVKNRCMLHGRVFVMFCSRHLGHMTKMVATPIYGKNPSKNLLLQNRQADFHETWYVASGTPVHHSLFK